MAPNVLAENLTELLGVIIRAKPSTAKGIYLQGVSLSTTMGPAVRLDEQAIWNEFRA
jgi:large subunit ribosomal protein L1